MSKKILFFIVLFISSSVYGFAQSEITPLKKPIQTKDETEKKLLIDVLKPLPKPIIELETKRNEEKKVVKKKIKSGPILPKKKTFNSRRYKI